METKSIGHYKEAYIRGPHLKYFVTAVAIALAIVVAIVVGVVFFIQLA